MVWWKNWITQYLSIWYFFHWLVGKINMRWIVFLRSTNVRVPYYHNCVFYQAFSVALAIIAGVLTVFFVSRLGKRLLTLMTLSICSVCYIAIGLIGVYCNNLEKSNQVFISWLILILYLTSTFMSSFGIMPISWILLSEIFPMKWVPTKWNLFFKNILFLSWYLK